MAACAFVISAIACGVTGTWVGSALDDQSIPAPTNASSGTAINGSLSPGLAPLEPDAFGDFWQTCLTSPAMSANGKYNDILSTVAEDFVIVGGLGLCLVTMALRWRWIFLGASVISGLTLIKALCQIVLHGQYLSSHALRHLTGAVGAQCNGAEFLVGALLVCCALMIVTLTMYFIIVTIGCLGMVKQSRLRYRPLVFASIALACVGFTISAIAITDAEEEGREIHSLLPEAVPLYITPLFLWTAGDLSGTPASSVMVDKYFILFICMVLGALLDGQLDVATQVLASELVTASIISTALCCVSLWPGALYYQRRYAVDGVFGDCGRWGEGTPADAVARAMQQVKVHGQDQLLRYDQLSRHLCLDHRGFFAGHLLVLVASHVLLLVRIRAFVRLRCARAAIERNAEPPAPPAAWQKLLVAMLGVRCVAWCGVDANSPYTDIDSTPCRCDSALAACRASCAFSARIALSLCTCGGTFLCGPGLRRILEGWGGNGFRSKVHLVPPTPPSSRRGTAAAAAAAAAGGRAAGSSNADEMMFDDSFDVSFLSPEDRKRWVAGGSASGAASARSIAAALLEVDEEIDHGGDDGDDAAALAAAMTMTPEIEDACEWLRAHGFEQHLQSFIMPPTAPVGERLSMRRGSAVARGLGVTSLAGLTLLRRSELERVGLTPDEVDDFISCADGLKLSVLL